ncbi:MAG: hypothetical protein JRN62_03410 [Nitrososphaerota archaeon]|nr:hypothetical protein [Nitrososphaerota archaeon]
MKHCLLSVEKEATTIKVRFNSEFESKQAADAAGKVKAKASVLAIEMEIPDEELKEFEDGLLDDFLPGLLKKIGADVKELSVKRGGNLFSEKGPA